MIQDCISSSLSDQILEFKYDEDLYEETVGPPDIASPPATNGGVAYQAVAPAVTIPAPADDDAAALSCYDNTFASSFCSFDPSELSAILDSQPTVDAGPDIPQLSMLPMAPAYPSDQMTQLDQMIATANGFTAFPADHMVSQLPLTLSGYLGLEMPRSRPCSYINAGEFYADGMGVHACGGEDEMGVFGGGRRVMIQPDARTGAEAHGIAICTPGSLHRVYGTGDAQHLVSRCGSSNSTSLPGASGLSRMEDSSFKVSRLSVEEKKLKIRRYLKKKKQRNFTKKIKYACRKTLADSRPRVRGRFAKNVESDEAAAPRPSPDRREYDDEEVMVKHEEDIVESSDILAHITGLNSFKYNYPVESWI